jgi:excinuclease ABC subunit A
MDGDVAQTLDLLRRFACPYAATASTELEPRLFSFNNPAGACPSCDGLGVEQFFDPAKVVRSPELSLADGAIRGWDRRNGYYFQMLKLPGGALRLRASTTLGTICEPFAQQSWCCTAAATRRSSSLPHEIGAGKRAPFEGILRNMERRYRETDSATVREELARSSPPAPAPTAAAPASARRRATCWWTARIWARSRRCRWARR